MSTPDPLVRGRESFARRAWQEAYAHLSTADEQAQLPPEDLERYATAAYLVGKDADSASSGRAPTRATSTAAGWSGLPAARSGWRSACWTAASRPAPAVGWPAPSGCSTAIAATASSRATCWCRRRSRAWTRATPRPRRHVRPGRRDRRTVRRPDLVTLARLGRGQALIAPRATTAAALRAARRGAWSP